jgi:hypothetical protein
MEKKKAEIDQLPAAGQRPRSARTKALEIHREVHDLSLAGMGEK